MAILCGAAKNSLRGTISDFFHPGSRVDSYPDPHKKIKEFLTQKNFFYALEKIIWDVHPGSRFRIRNTGFDANPDSDPELDRHQDGNSDPDRHQHDADPQHFCQPHL
jgi:hypothetical protein